METEASSNIRKLIVTILTVSIDVKNEESIEELLRRILKAAAEPIAAALRKKRNND
jgi:hypothetical protein